MITNENVQLVEKIDACQQEHSEVFHHLLDQDKLVFRVMALEVSFAQVQDQPMQDLHIIQVT